MLIANEFSEKGFSILKVIISIFIFSISIAALNSQKIFFLKMKKFKQNQKIEMPKIGCEKKQSTHFIFDFCNDIIIQQKGFTLIECIVSIGLLSLLLTTASSWAFSSIKFSAKEKIEQLQYEKLEALSILAQSVISSGAHFNSLQNILIDSNFDKSARDTQALSLRSFDSYILNPSTEKNIYCLRSLNSQNKDIRIETQYWLALSSTTSFHVKSSFKIEKRQDPRCLNEKSYRSDKIEVIDSIFNKKENEIAGDFFLLPVKFLGTFFLSTENALKVYEHNKNYAQPIRSNLKTLLISKIENFLHFSNSKHTIKIKISNLINMSEKEFFIILTKLNNKKSLLP